MILKQMSNKKRAGFTLVELVIVVTILGVLSGVGLVKFGNIQETSRKNADYITASNLATATNLYLLENPSASNYIDLETLKNKGYINSIPKSQSQKGKDFIIEIINTGGENKSEQLRVLCKLDNGNEVVFYPKQTSNN